MSVSINVGSVAPGQETVAGTILNWLANPESLECGVPEFVLASRAEGSVLRLNAAGQPAPLSQHEVREALAGIAVPVTAFESLPDGDACYYAYRSDAELPVYRWTFGGCSIVRCGTASCCCCWRA